LPALKKVMMKSSRLSANDSIAAATMPGRMSGKVTRKKVRTGVAPRSRAASSRVQSNPRTRARTVRATKLTWNITWAITIVPTPVCTSASRNRVSSEEPITTSGVVRGRIRNVSRAPLPRNRWRTSATAMSVPSTTAIDVEMAATRRLRPMASTRAG
jgi:hypothetical protein